VSAPEPAAAVPAQVAAPPVSFVLRAFEAKGATALSPYRMTVLTDPYIGKPMSDKELGDLIAAMRQAYEQQGMGLVSVGFPTQDVSTGTLSIEVIEPRLGRVQVAEGPDAPVTARRVEGLLSFFKLKAGGLLHTQSLERVMFALNDMPGVQAKATLAPAGDEGVYNLSIQTQARRAWDASLAIDNQGGNAETVSGDVRSYELSADGKKLMLVRGGIAGAAPEILIVDAAPKLPAELPKFQVRWSDWQIATQPRAEWRQMFVDAWRMQRDHFYDKAMHGVDWQAVRAKYEPLVERVSTRAELAELMAQMVGELGALHSQVGAGDVRIAPEEPGIAGLGARFSREPEGWRIEKIYASDPELPAEASPLAATGLDLKAGDVITAVNGRRAAAAPHLAELLRGQAGKQVLLELRSAEGKPLQKIVVPVAQRRETQLRYNDWRQSRARAVQQASGGRIGYLHLRAMGPEDIADFAREFYAQIDREGLIIDVRFNNGGNIDSWLLEKLLRRAWAFWQSRSPEGAPPYANMQQAFRGHLAVLINENTYSDGETFAEGFKRLGLGPAIGRQTSGAGVWLSDRNRLMDNGIMRAAENGQMDASGHFLIEGVGVKPDIEVDNLPRATFLGGDAQLDAAIAHLRRAMAERPLLTPKPGAYPRPVKP